MKNFAITVTAGNYPQYYIEELDSVGCLVGKNADLFEDGFSSYEEAKKRCDELTREVEKER